MTFRAVVQDGLIVVNTHGTIPDGTPVNISIAKTKRGAAPKRSGRKKVVSSRKNARHTPTFGMWADRDELGSPEEAVDRLRALTRRRRFA